jgi:hypothetical protein
MTRASATFRQRDVTAAIRAARAAGVELARIEVTKDGTIRMTIGTPPKIVEVAPGECPGPDEWDDLGQT